MLEIIGLIAPFFGLIAVGGIAGRAKKLPVSELGWLNVFVVYIALPALFFSLLSETPVEKLTQWSFIATNVGMTFTVAAVTFGLGMLFSRGKVADSTIQGLAGAYGNIGYMGPGLALLVFGPEAAVPVALIFCFENIMHFTLAPAMMALAGRDTESPARLALTVVRQVVTHPFIVAVFLGVAAAVTGWEPPAPLARLIDYLAQAAAPCALFAMGVTLANRRTRGVPGALGYIVPMKLLGHPFIMLAGLTFFGPFDPVWVGTAVLLAALPTASNVFVMAQQFETWVDQASASILVTTLLSIVTVTLLLYGIESAGLLQ
ncbi:AEC family transporter [Rhodospira trueperi]|uniref:Malonate transporter n=1 Tax=Rhodospira trueperi TaxID=69960 RepID=A0A1G7FI63_9PROT|nr:AEC family transporter [Rhodospira trueperi]SDE75636.1 hypothetical protein SAMN05421720_11184 [Rhodospira trueperi]